MLLVESDHHRRAQLSEVLRTAGFPVTAVGRIAEVERWPADEVVITDSPRFTRWWTEVGASHVIVLADNAKEGERACTQGATTWIDRTCTPERLVEVLVNLGVRNDKARSASGHHRGKA
jgi:DNA-binding response OmpR family regulator